MARFLKRERVYSVLKITGAFRMWQFCLRNRLLVVNYHRILSNHAANPFDDGVVSCSPDIFEAHIRSLAKRRNIISMDALIGALDGKIELPKCPTLITFDDGYVDNYVHAFPILKKYTAPACFFLPTNRITTRQLEWWDHIAYMVKNAEQRQYKLCFGGNAFVVDLRDEVNQTKVAAEIIARAKMTDQSADILFEEFNVSRPDPALESSQIMTDTQIREIIDEPGFSIGAHSVSHRVLSTLTREENIDELRTSKNILEDRFDVKIDAFAYPVGDDQHYTRESVLAAKEVGYKCAFNFRLKARSIDINNCDRFNLDRVTLPDDIGGIFSARSSGFLF